MTSEGVRTLRIIRGLWRATGGGPSAIATVQRARLSALVALAADRSPYYRRRYRGLDLDRASPPDLRRLPTVDKRDLMEHFDEWATEPDLRRAAVEAFVADPGRVGELLEDRYAV